MRKAVVYPYSEAFLPVLRHISFLKEYQITKLFAPHGWGSVGTSISMGMQEIAVRDAVDLKALPDGQDTLLVPEFRSTVEQSEEILKRVLSAAPKFERVLCLLPIEEAWERRLRDACGGELICLGRHVLDLRKRPLKLLPAPVAVVAGCWEETDKFSVSLMLREQLLKRNYRVSQIGVRESCELLGFHSFPWEIMDRSCSDVEKVYELNRYVRELMDREEPDILLLEVPGPIQSANGDYMGGFGILPFLVFQALTVDYLVLCTLLCENADKPLQELSNLCKYRFGVEADCFHISNLQFNLGGLSEELAIPMRNMTEEWKHKILGSFAAVSVVDATLEDGASWLAEDIVEKLS